MDSMKDEVFPPPHSPGQGARGAFDDDDEDGGADVSQLADVPAAKRKGVKRPQPKLDSQRLISERGLPALRTLFDDVCFKGKGHEPEDLRLLMQKMENWAHRLYPKLQFEDFIDKVEKLGSKKDVQTCLKRIRMDMPLTHEDFMGDDDDDDDDDDDEEAAAAAAAPESQAFGDPDPFNSSSFNNMPVHSTPAPAAPPDLPSLTEEQRQRIELNRQRALERRLTRQQQTDSPANNSQGCVEEAESLDPEPASSTPPQKQEPGQLPHTDPEPPAASPLSDEKEEPVPGKVPGLRGECGDGDQCSEFGNR